MPYQPRDYDRESGQNRVSRSRSHQAPPPRRSNNPFLQEESDSDYEVQELTSREHMQPTRYRDDTRRAPTRPQPREPKPVDTGKTPNYGGDEKTADEVEPAQKQQPQEVRTADHMSFLIDASFYLAIRTLTSPEISEYTPNTRNLFQVTHHMARLLTKSTLHQSQNPAFTSVGFYLYHAHLVYYQILRARDAEDILTDDERRTLRAYGAIGKPEAWPVLTPAIGFLQALGTVKPEGGKYGAIIPKFPAISGLGAGDGLTQLNTVEGLGNMPLVPALHQFLHLMGKALNTGYHFGGDRETLIPGPKPTNAAPNTISFLGINSTLATSKQFIALTRNAAWLRPFEIPDGTANLSMKTKTAEIRTWGIPTIPDGTTFTTLRSFLRLDTNAGAKWIKELISTVNKTRIYFPGSITLGAIPTTTRLETFSQIVYTNLDDVQVIGENGEWFVGREDWRLKMTGFVKRDDAPVAFAAAMSVSSRASLDAMLIPTFTVPITTHFTSVESGPYFDNAPDEVTIPLPLVEAQDQDDPTERMRELIEANLFDSFGGKPRA